MGAFPDAHEGTGEDHRLRPRPKEVGVKVLITAASRYGATQEIAEAIGRVLTDHGLEVKVTRAEGLDDVTAYDAVVVGSAAYMGEWLPAARRFVDEYGEELAKRPTWLFSSGPLGSPLRPNEEQAVQLGPIWSNTRAMGHRLFAGKLDKSQLGFKERVVVNAVRAPEGDYRDWDDIEAWAADIAETLVWLEAQGLRRAA
jgi:menaquinone-dependent protoporphyrinogen oxidase